MGQKDIMTQRLFPDAQRHLFEKSYQEQLEEEHNRTVECLGLSFANDEERRQHFLAILREKLKDTPPTGGEDRGGKRRGRKEG